MVIAGVMSGSSLDGLDIAVVRFSEENEWQCLWSYEMSYTEEWVENLRQYYKLSASEYILFKADYSRYIGQLLKKALAKCNVGIDYLSFHGHTLVHRPELRTTEQIGNGGIIASITGIPAITDYRVQDLEFGGVGTPLAPLADIHLFPGHDYYLNLGGIANITKVRSHNQFVAYDICPCNQVLNHYSQLLGHEYDEGGEMARKGTKLREMEAILDSFPFFSLTPPKSLDNNWIVNDLIPRLPNSNPIDALHTYTHWMADCIAKEVDSPGSPTSLLVSGGGGHNKFFIESLSKKLAEKDCTLTLPTREIINFKEAMLMALMGYNYIIGKANVLSAATGASRDSIGGAMYKV